MSKEKIHRSAHPIGAIEMTSERMEEMKLCPGEDVVERFKACVGMCPAFRPHTPQHLAVLDDNEWGALLWCAQSVSPQAGEGVVEREQRENRRNVYRLQMGGNRLCDALRQIAAGCDEPTKVARRALDHKEPDPDWAALPPAGRVDMGDIHKALEWLLGIAASVVEMGNPGYEHACAVFERLDAVLNAESSE